VGGDRRNPNPNVAADHRGDRIESGWGEARRGESNDSVGKGEEASAKAKWGGRGGGEPCLAFGEEKGPEIAALTPRDGALSMTGGALFLAPLVGDGWWCPEVDKVAGSWKPGARR
jgi:hypothetical protein